MYKKDLTPAQIRFVKDEYAKGEMTVAEIAAKVGISTDSMNRKAKKLGIKKISKTNSKWTHEKIKWLKQNYNLTYKELSEYLGICDDAIRVKINELGITRTTKYRPFKIDPEDEQFWRDIDNPRLSAPDIVAKYKDIYGIQESCIWAHRRRREIKVQLNNIQRESSLEVKVREILDKLDFAYIKEKRVGRFSIDFYLGHKLCIEVQGDYWHNRPERKERDKRKQLFLEKQGFKILYIWENNLSNARKDIIKFASSMGFPVEQSTVKKLCERKQKRCIRVKSNANGER